MVLGALLAHHLKVYDVSPVAFTVTWTNCSNANVTPGFGGPWPIGVIRSKRCLPGALPV